MFSWEWSKKISKWPTQRKKGFSKLPILNIFLWNFNGLVLGLVGLIDVKGIDVPYQCPSPQSILLIQGPVHEIFTKKCWELVTLKNPIFLSRLFWGVFFSKKKSACFIAMKISNKLRVRMNGIQFLWLWWFRAKNTSPQTFQLAV